MKKGLEAAEVWSYRRIMKMPWTEHNEKVLRDIKTKKGHLDLESEKHS